MKRFILIYLILATFQIHAQTEIDGIMMEKNNFCTGAVYEYSSWNKYWEGGFKRENLNFGTVSTQKYALMGNYGISNKLNIIFNIPYIITNASSGTMIGQKGVQDLSLTLKYLIFEKEIKQNLLSFYVFGGYSLPTTNYAADYLPLSIGLQSKTGTIRLMSDYQFGKLFATSSTAYVKRSNIKIDRNSYLTNEMHYTNEVDMPDAISTNVRFGYRTNRLILEAIYDNWVTQAGGFDITSNNMPFPSNTMNASKWGINSKYTFEKVPGLSLVGGYNSVIDGRNVGQSNTIYVGFFYLMNLKKIKKDATSKK
jgi:hypothetical protein